jgi:2-iminoacetate synthase
LKFIAEKYKIPDQPFVPFIDEKEIWQYLNNARVSDADLDNILNRSLNKHRLNLNEVAVLIQAQQSTQIEKIKSAARKLKENVYGNRIVLFAPLYVGNKCVNNCEYCGFKASNNSVLRKTLERKELIRETEVLENEGQKRLILVFGEHPDYSPDFIADTVKTVYKVKNKNGEIRRVNINAAPLDVEGFKKVYDAGIGTYQVFQETYHRETYKKYHRSGRKSDYDYRLTSMDRALEAGQDDVGIGALLGLYDWRFELMAMIRHTNHLEACYNVGPHTISFPRIQDASDTMIDDRYKVSDEELSRMIAILRLAVPYTGLILTARENRELRKELLSFGVSQIDGGTKIELGGYSAAEASGQDLNKEQFRINDDRSLNEIMDELISDKFLPSFCTACYRKGRTGEHFMEFSVPGFIKRFCTPNAVLTLAEYLMDYAPEDTASRGWELIDRELNQLRKENHSVTELERRLELVRRGERDLFF